MRWQIVTNALTNAIKYTAPGPDGPGGISMSASVDAAARQLVIEVADRGPGLRGQTLAQLKTEFGGFGGAPVSRSGIRSSGLGIPICFRLAELMGGVIQLADRGDGPGARFTLKLPLRESAVVAAAAGTWTAAAAAAAGVAVTSPPSMRVLPLLSPAPRSSAALPPPPPVATPSLPLPVTRPARVAPRIEAPRVGERRLERRPVGRPLCPSRAARRLHQALGSSIRAARREERRVRVGPAGRALGLPPVVRRSRGRP